MSSLDWIYLAGPTQADLPSTLESVLQHQLLWRPATNSKGALISNVGHLQVGDWIVLAWRVDRRAYLRCRIASPLKPAKVAGRVLVIDRLVEVEADKLSDLGYRAGGDGAFEVIRFDEIQECYFPLHGRYAGNNALHRLAEVDLPIGGMCNPIPPAATERAPDIAARLKGKPRRPAGTGAVDTVRVRGTGGQRAFDAYVMVDWSSSSRPTTGNDSIWVAAGKWSADEFTAAMPENLDTRRSAAGHIAALARDWAAEGKRVLIGMDFAFGYPAGFANALGLETSNGAWRAIHEYVAREVSDDLRNRHNRDAFAALCNQRIEPSGPGPFWGCAANAATPFLTQQRLGIFRFPYPGGIAEWRTTDWRAKQRTVTQSVWKLNCGVSVGGQTILGIKHLHALAATLDARLWPFETGWTTPAAANGSVWFAEIFPSLIRYGEWDSEYALQRDRTQVQSCVRRAAEEDSSGTFAARFGLPTGLSEAERAKVEGEEGWILWVP